MNYRINIFAPGCRPPILTQILCLIALIGAFAIGFPSSLKAQSLNGFMQQDSMLVRSMDSVLTSIQALTNERVQLNNQIRNLNTQIRSLEGTLDARMSSLMMRHDIVLKELDTLRILMPSEEPMKATNMNVVYLSRRQDSLVAYVERLESHILQLPEKHYWGVRNGFKEFDHLLLFTFLGATTSLGLVSLVRGGKRKEEDAVAGSIDMEERADQMSISITLLVGSILVVLFILFIL